LVAMKRERSIDETRELWVQAREAKDYVTADGLREELRAEGFDPDPPHWSADKKQKVDTQEKLVQWRDAKAVRDFVTADSLRAELRAEGVDPDQPKWREAGPEDMLQMWQTAKQNKDYKTADDLRAQLRKAGVDPDVPGIGRQESNPVQDMLAQWQAARDTKQWIIADSLRVQLRGMGVDPDPRPGTGVHESQKQKTYGFSHGVHESQMPAANADFKPQVPAAGWGGPSTPFSAVDNAQSAMSLPYNPEVEAALDEWVEARSQKDWSTADSIRDVLRKSGVEPDKMRPSSVRDLTPEYELGNWQRAKQARDFTRADKIRESLRSKGVDPDSRQGVSYSSNFGNSSGVNFPKQPALAKASSMSYNSTATRQEFDVSTELELDKWWAHKQAKDWVQADAIRAQLRQMGIEPEQHRP